MRLFVATVFWGLMMKEIKNHMKFLDLFAGIGGFRLGMESAGHECIGFCEIDKFARASYKAIHDTKGEIELHDITAVSDESIRRIGRVDIICGGFPCQAFSIAGNRRGFEDTRGSLFFEIARFASILRPKYLFLENVKGLLNHDGGATFETILGALDELGYNVEWENINSKNFGITDGYRIRKLTPRECWRLQGFPDWAFDKAQKVNSNSQLYKQAGNSVTVSVIAAIAKELK